MDKTAPRNTSQTATTRVFKSGNSQAVRIPAEMAFDSTDQDLTISRHGDVVMIYPKRPSMEETIAALRALPDDTKLGPIERTQTRLTKWDTE